jgi:orotidine-5'-phosphate decarboxylase
MNAVVRLMDRMASADTIACCGLDPDVRRLPDEISRSGSSDSDKVYSFLREVIDAAAPHVCAFKAQKAFFDILPDGHDVLRRLVKHIHRDHPGIPVFVDGKIGDIDNTMQAYAHLLLEEISADGVLVNPYMGDEVIQAFSGYPDRAIIILARTSNPGAAIVQDAPMADSQPLWRHILGLIVGRWNTNGNLIPVIAATAGLNMALVRPLIPDQMPVLLAGIGAQGGEMNSLCSLLNKNNTGVFVNSSRALLYPVNPDGVAWQEAVRLAVVRFKLALNQSRRQPSE